MNPLGLQDFLKEQARAADRALAGGMSFSDAVAQVRAEEEQKKSMRELEKQRALAESGLFTPEVLAKDLPVGPVEGALDLATALSKDARSRMGEIPRSEMPQVHAWQAKDDGVPMGKLEFVDPKKLKYTQEKINGTKAQGIANHWDTVGKEPILISRDNWVLDGHHRVEAARMKKKWVRCFRIDLPGRTALNRLKEVEPGTEDPA